VIIIVIIGESSGLISYVRLMFIAYYLRQVGYVSSSVCLFVGLSTGLLYKVMCEIFERYKTVINQFDFWSDVDPALVLYCTAGF